MTMPGTALDSGGLAVEAMEAMEAIYIDIY